MASPFTVVNLGLQTATFLFRRALSGRAKIEQDGGLRTFTIEATVSEMHRMQSRIARHPIEDGSDIADHIHHDPDGLIIEGMVSDSPIPFNEILEGNLGQNLKAYAGFNRGIKRSQQAFRDLESLRANKQPVTIVTGYKRYTDMGFSLIQVPKDTPREELRFRLELEKITRAVSSEVNAQIKSENIAAGSRDAAASESDVGTQAASEPTSAVEDAAEEAKGALDSAFEWGKEKGSSSADLVRWLF